MANDAYNIVKYMRAVGMDVDLILNKQDFGMSFPQWEDGLFRGNVDPYQVDKGALETLDSLQTWIRVWDQDRFGPGVIGRAAKRVDLFRLLKDYDIIEAHVPAAIYAQFLNVPYIVYDAGWIRCFPSSDQPWDKLARRGYMKACAVLVTNPDTFWIFDKLPFVTRTVFMPFVIDLDIYRPLRTTQRSQFECDLLLFAPSRQSWKEKGNEKLLLGYSKFLKSCNPHFRPLLVMVDWGPDAERSKTLAMDLTLSEHVQFIKPVHKRELVQYYNAADAILDQFTLGSYGTAAPEAMACEKPVIMYYSEKAFRRTFGELPPLLNAYNPEDIEKQLTQCVDHSFRMEIGKKSRQWVEKHHGWRLVVEKHRRLYSFALGECEWEDILNDHIH